MTSQSDEPEASAPVAEQPSSEGPSGRELWDSVRIEPVEIALPGGVGLTLRAYRPAGEVTPTEIEVDEDDPFEARKRVREEDGEEFVEVSDEELERQALDAAAADPDLAEKSDATEPAAETETEDEPEAAADRPDDEEVPLFLSHKGRLLAFKSTESLVAFLRSGAPHDLAQLDTWEAVAERVQSSDIDPLPENRYELDLVVENLRGGHDTWDLPLLIAAGEVARDLGHALRIKPVILALSPGSPLDDLDESLRTAENGGMGGFFGRRRLKKIGAQQASLGWRSVIGKISAAVDWRD
ncbi:DNA primase [Actinoplanes missouriensis]|uniref:DNA primase n=1 Tax=Actinoplanes missouriensis TaxID=1866 RepID=UPI0002DD4E8B|nr:DNA primase [Actinoplanes missouriensis]